MNRDEDSHLSRADKLMARARSAGVSNIDEEMSLLPDGDLVARIGFLANALGIDPALALDVDLPLVHGTD